MAKKAKKKGSVKRRGKGKGKSDFMGTVKSEGMDMAGIAAGIIAAQKFADFKTVFKDQYAKDPGSALFKHEGLIKAGAALFAYSKSRNAPPFVKNAIIGAGVQGVIMAVRQYTYDEKTGNSFVSQIGNSELDNAINALAAEVKSVAEESRTNVGGPEQTFNSNTSVGSTDMGGMGMEMDND